MQAMKNEKSNIIPVKLDDGAILPARAYEADAGMDLLAPLNFPETVIPSMGSLTIDTGVHMQIPYGFFGKIESKSGLNVNHSVVSCGGVIDSGFSGSIKVKIYNFGTLPYVVSPGRKVAQIIIMPCVLCDCMEVENLPQTKRGNNGFGSTGV